MKLQARAVAAVGGGMLTGLMRTTRIEFWNLDIYEQWWGAGRPVIFVLWHGRLLPCSYARRHQRLATLISQHRDGDYIAGVVEGWWGYHAIRGSSSRGGTAAMRDMVKTLRRGTAIAVTPDGPRGPREKMKLGPLIAAQLAGVPIIPATAGCDRAWWVGGWDRFLIPKPFSRIRMMFGEPIFVARDLAPSDLEAAAMDIEDRLKEMTSMVDRSWTAE